MEDPTGKKVADARLKKNPQAPRRFKSPYILFSISKMQEYHSKFNHVKVTSLSSRISREWKDMSEEDKDHWRRAAERDKMRYNAEKSTFTGPWTVARNKRPPKDPSAPKRPPSAFLNFCRSRRRVLCQANPGLKNTDISKLLGHEWRSASEDMKRPFVEQEQQERQAYHIRIAAWKEERKHQEDFVKHHQQELVLEDPLLSYTESEGFEAMAPAQPEAIDWSMTASTSMSLKPVPITATAMNTFASKPLPIAPRKVTLDVDSSQEVDNITASSTSHLALSTDETFFNTLSGQHAVISSTPPADDSLAVPMERPIASSPSATFATRATNMNTLAEAASKFEDNSIPMLHYGLVSDEQIVDPTMDEEEEKICLSNSSDEEEMMFFPKILDGDTIFDPPLLAEAGMSSYA